MTTQSGASAGRLLAAALAFALGTGLAGAAPADNVIDLTIDFAKLMKLDRPAHTIVIGNPGVADASVQDGTTVVLTGKAAGTTNLIVLDDKGAEVTNATLRVASNIRQLTTIYRGRTRQTYSCAPTCDQVIVVGDDPSAFGIATQQIQARQQFTNGQ